MPTTLLMRKVGNKRTLPTLHHFLVQRHTTLLMRKVGNKRTLPTLHHYITEYNGFENQTD
ncbi:MAG: hypothetical protein KAI83_11670 [Thiomargarita sp.]|nr:hypothetical protein [Thiomargarita sp.]